MKQELHISFVLVQVWPLPHIYFPCLQTLAIVEAYFREQSSVNKMVSDYCVYLIYLRETINFTNDGLTVFKVN